MKTDFKKSFLKALQKLRNKKLKNSILNIITEVESADEISKISNLKQLKGYAYYYRIRVSDYRIGVKIDKDTVTFVIFDNRKDIYRKFP